jgi:hypothetical protein
MAAAADKLGLNNAARNLNHYLDNNGDDLYETPEEMMADLPDFNNLVLNLVQTQAKDAYAAAAVGSGSSRTFSTPWNGYDYKYGFNKDWYYAVGAFSYSVAGIVTTHRVSSNSTAYTAKMNYVVYVFDRYNWDGGKSVEIGPFTFEDKDLGRMHLVGLAKEYIVRGTSAVQAPANWSPDATLPPPPVPTGDDGRGGRGRG